MKERSVSTKVMELVAKAAQNSAVHNANSACAWWQAQPTLPASVKKLRKF